MNAEDAARHLLAARDKSHRTAALPEAARPHSAADAYAIQAAISAQQGEVGGWKVGSPSPTSDVFTCAPLPVSGIVDSPATTQGSDRVVEAEIAVRLGADLPTRDRPYDDHEIRAAIASAHPAIEVLESRFSDADAIDPFSNLADSLGHHSLVVGPSIADWDQLDLDREEVAVLVDGREIKRRTGNPGGDMIRLVAWLANTGARWAGGLRKGQVVTTGSWTAKDTAPEASEVVMRFTRAGEVSTRFAP